MRDDPPRSRQMETAVSQHREQQRMFARSSSNGDPEIGLLLGQVQDIGAVRKHRWFGRPRIEATRVHFRDVGDQHSLYTPRCPHEFTETTEELVIRETVDDRQLTLEQLLAQETPLILR